MIIIPWTFNPDTAIDCRTRSTGSHGLIVKGKRISCPPHSSRQSDRWCRTRDDYEHGFQLIRSLRASAQRSTSVLFSFVLSLLIVAGSFAIRQSKTILSRSTARRGLFLARQTPLKFFYGRFLRSVKVLVQNYDKTVQHSANGTR